MKQDNNMYILSNGRVASINKKDGQIIWEVKLKEYVKHTGYAVGQINVEGDKIYVGVAGILLCLRTKDGSLVWKNELKGWGYYFVSMSNVGNTAHAASISQAEMAASTGISSTTT